MSDYIRLLEDSFDDLQGKGNEADSDFKPLYSIDYNNEEELINWLTNICNGLQEEGAPRVRNMYRNIMFLKGVHTLKEDSDYRASDYDNNPISDSNRFVMNHILEFALQKQSRLMRFGPTINVFPWNNSYADRLGARLGKKIIDSAFYIQDFESKLATITLDAPVCGEQFLFIEWDKFKGDKSKDLELAERRAKEFEGLSFTNESGQKIDLKSIPRVGDHKLTIPMPGHVLHEPKGKWSEVNYIFKCTILHIDEVRAENSHLGREVLEKIANSNQGASLQSAFSTQGRNVIQWEFYHKKHRFLPEGKYAKFFNNVLIEHGDLPYSHGELPCARLTDYDDPVNAHGRSFLESLKLPSVMINNMMKVAYRSYVISAYPKIIMQRDSVNMYSMANGPFVMEHEPGSSIPQIVSFNAVNKDFFPLSDHVEKFMEKNSGTFGISRGDQVPNARARSILNFYEEQEQERESSQIRKFSAFIEKCAKQLLANSADYYKPEDGRTIRIVGKNNQHKLVKMNDKTKLSGEYNVKIERTTALSESKQGKIDQISTLSNVPLSGQEGVGLFTREQILGMIEVADVNSFFELAASASEAANSENEDMFEGLPVNSPEPYQSHLVHWNVHYQFIQSREFTDTTDVPASVKDKFLSHLSAHEFILYKKALTNLALATTLSENKYFPAVFKLKEGQDLPLSQVILQLQQPPMPPMPPMGEGMLPMGGSSELLPDIPQSDPPLATDELNSDPNLVEETDSLPVV
jgi:hypothetical protein